MSAADSNTSLPEKKSGYTFGHNETLLLISLYQKYEVFFSDVSYKKKAGPGPRISTGVFLCRQSELFLAFRTNHSYSRIVDKKRVLSEPARRLFFLTVTGAGFFVSLVKIYLFAGLGR